jgi:hypothetical protein
VAVEKLLSVKFAKIKSCQDAPQTTFSVFLDIFYPPNSCCFEENGVFQQPQAITPTTFPASYKNAIFRPSDAASQHERFSRTFLLTLDRRLTYALAPILAAKILLSALSETSLAGILPFEAITADARQGCVCD